ncbi:unnamed protein product [Amoebophrya sp. A120]|nr:unnamed protein product [Amoebophrya sp. A120]|eukprot:GSA120T00000307001.1
MATIEALRKAEQAFRALDECSEAKEKLNLLLRIEKFVLVDDPSYRCIEAVLQNFLHLRHYDSRPPPLRRYLAYFLEQVALRKSKMALRCVPACISLLEDPDSLTRQIAIQSARSLQSRALLLIAKASSAQSSNVEAACQALAQLQDRIWKILEYSVQNLANDQSKSTPFHQACLFIAHQIIITTSSAVFVRPSIGAEQRGVASIEDIPPNDFLSPTHLTERATERLSGLITLLDQCLTQPQAQSNPDHVISLLDALSVIGRYRPQILSRVLEAFQKCIGQDPWLDTLLSFHVRSFLACPLDGDYHATCVHVLKRIDPTSAGLPMENLIAVARQDQLRAKYSEKRRNPLVQEILELPFDGDTLLGTEQVVSASELVETDQTKYVEPYTLMTLRLNPKDAARVCLTGLEKQLDSAKTFEQPLRATKDLEALPSTGGAAVAGGGGKVGTQGAATLVPGSGKVVTADSFLDEADQEVADPRARKRQKIKDSTKEQYLDTTVTQFEGSAGQQQIQGMQQMVFHEVLQARSRMMRSLQASCVADSALKQFDQMNNRVVSHLASFIEDPLLEEVFYGKAIGKALVKSNDTWQQDILPLFYAKYASTIQRTMEDRSRLKVALEVASDHDFSYASLFDLFLRVYAKQFGTVTKKELREFFGLLPYLPESLFAKLEGQCHHEGTRRQALITCFYVAEKFPQARAQAMRVLFKMAYTHLSEGPITDESTCQTATRFLAGKVYSPQDMLSKKKTEEEGGEAGVVEHQASSSSSSTTGAAQHQVADTNMNSVIALDALKGKDLEDLATQMLRSMVGYQKFGETLHPSGYVRQIVEEILNNPHVVPGTQRHWLFLAMSIKKPLLLTQLLEVYSIAEQQAGPLEAVKDTLAEHIGEAVKHIDPEAQQGTELLEVIGATERVNALDLVGKMLQILLQERLDTYAQASTDEERKARPMNLPFRFRDVVLAKYESLGNPRLLMPIIALVPRNDCVRYLTDLLTSSKMSGEDVKWIIRHLVRSSNHETLVGEVDANCLGVAELLSEIHHLNTTLCDLVPTAKAVICLNTMHELLEADEIDVSRYVFALQSLAEEEEEAVGFPTLMFRTLIRLQKHTDFLNDFISTEILPALVKKPIIFSEKHSRLQEGIRWSIKYSFEKAADKRVPAKVLSLLPLQQLEDQLAQFPEWKNYLKEYCATQPLHLIPHHVRQLLQ